MRKRKRLTLHKNKRNYILKIIFAAVVIAVMISVGVRADKAVRPVAEMQAEHFALLTANEAIEKAVSQYLEENKYTYSDFAAVLYDESGRAVSVEAIPYNINRVQSELTLAINRNFSEISEKSVKIPIGSLSGSYMLNGKGPCIKLRICPVGSASVKLTGSFTSAGNNQTCHRISAEVTAEIQSSVPLYSFRTNAEFEFLLAESIIVGEVPDIGRYAWNSLGYAE